jgi:PAS domain S-box-containing protein
MNFSINLKRSNLLSSLPSAWLVLTLSLTFTGWLWYDLEEDLFQTNYAQFESRVERVKTAIVERMLAYQQALQGGAGLFNASTSVSRQQWHNYITSLHTDEYYPGFLAFAFSKYLLPKELPAHIAQVRAEGFPNYQVLPAGQRDEYTPVVYIEPLLDRFLPALGYDISTQPTRRAAIEQARDTGKAAISGKVTLVPDATNPDKPVGFLMYVPVYRTGQTPATVAERRTAIFGYVQGAFRMKDLMHNLLGQQPLDIDYEIYDGDNLVTENLMYDNISHSSHDEQPQFTKTIPLNLAGHRWTLHFASLPQFEVVADNGTPEVVLVTGILMSFLLFLLIRGNARLSDSQEQLHETIKQLQHFKNTLEQEVAYRTEALQQEIQERMQAERALRETHERFLTVLDGLEAIVYVADMQTHEFLFANKYVRNLVGTQESLAGQICWQKMHQGQTGPCAFCTNDKLVSPEGQPTGVYTWELQNSINHQWFYIQDRAIRWTDGRLVRLEIATDITQRKQTEVELSKSVSLLHATLEATADGILVVDQEGRIAGFNQNFIQIWQIPEAIIASRDDSQTLQTVLGQLQEPQQFLDKVKELYAHPDQESFDILEFLDGRVFERYSKPQRLGNETIGRVWSFRDITTRRQTEQALREKEMRFRMIFHNAAVGISVIDRTGGFIESNSKLLDMLGYSREEMTQLTSFNITYPDDLDRSREKALQMVAGLIDSYHLEKRYVRKDGSVFWGDLYVTPQRDPNGNIVDFTGIIIDITERKRAEEALRQSEERFDLAMRGSNDGVWDFNLETNEVYYSPRWKSMLGYAEHEVRNHVDEFNRLVHPDDRAMVWEKITAYLEKQIPTYEVTFRMQHKEGHWVWILTRGMAIWNEQGKPYRMVGIHTDLTAQKQAEDSLRESEVHNRTLLEESPIGFILLDLTGKFVEANRAFLNIVGYSLEELGKLTFAEITPPHKYDQLDTQMYQTLLTTGRCGPFEKEYVHKAGHLVPIRASAVILERKGQQFLWANIEDIILQKQAQESLRQSEERFYLAMRGSNDGVWDWNMEANELYWSPRLRQILGLSEDETVSIELFNQLIHSTDVEPVWQIIKGYLEKQGSSYEVAFRMQHRQGHYVWTLARGAAVWNAQGKPTRLVGTIMDISTQKQAEEELRQAKESVEQAYLEASRFKAILDNTVDYVALHDVQTLQFIYVNQGAINQIGYTREELLQMTPLDINPVVNVEETKVVLAPLLSGSQPSLLMESVHQHKNGALIPVELQLQYLDIGQTKRLIAMARDITERKRFEQSLQQAKETAELANRAKSIFLANMSHELRTPLNGILGYTQIFQRDKTLTPKQLDGINIIHRSGEYLLTLINDILDLSKIEAGKVELLPVDFDFNEFLLGLTELFQMRAQQKGIAFNYEPLSHLPVGIRADEKRLRQILINLLGNAVKFTQHGGVTLKMGYHNGNIRFQVEDTGVGIAAADLEKIFEPFQQVGDQKYQAEGTGLGLPITKKLVEMMGGELHVESTLGKGSAFWMALELPEVSHLVKAKREQAPVIIGCQGPSRTILIIDDKWENRSVLINLLTPLGFILTEARHGEEGLNLLKAAPVDLIITDLVMPVMDGFEFARQLRKLPNFQTVPIMAASASVFDAHQQESLTAGCNAFMAKPFHVDVLLELLQKQLGLTWIYEQTTVNHEPSSVPTGNPASNPAEVIGPTRKQAAVLFNLAMQGDIVGIVEEVNKLEQTDGRLATFAKQIRQLAKNFEEQQICELVEKYMSEEV